MIDDQIVEYQRSLLRKDRLDRLVAPDDLIIQDVDDSDLAEALLIGAKWHAGDNVDEVGDEGQLELPGLAFSDGNDFTRALNELERELGRLQLSDEEAELLRRFRRTTADNRRMIMQILGH